MAKPLPLHLTLALLLSSAWCNAQVDPALAAQLQQILDDRVANQGDHGVSACLILPNGDTWTGTAGVGKDNIAIADSTVFHGASTTKANVATLLLLLAEDGLVDLDAPWSNYVTNLNVGFNTGITVRQLIGNTSGIADYLEAPGSGANVTSDFTHAFTPAEILEDIVSDVPDFAPGTDFAYSTSNFVLAALVAEAVTGNPVQQELRSRIWAPLGMTHTYFGGSETYTEPRAGVWWNFGGGQQDYSNEPETSMLTFGFGGANIVSTPTDLAHFARALFTGQVLSAPSMTEMQTISPDSYSSWTAGYGLGIHHAYPFASADMLGHDGYYTNMTDMFHSFDHGFTLVTMTNTQTDWFEIFEEMYNAVEDHITTGVAEHSASSPLSIYPNPSNGTFTVVTTADQTATSLEIVNAVGEVVYTEQIRGKSTHVVDAGLAAGVYCVRVGGAMKKVVVE